MVHLTVVDAVADDALQQQAPGLVGRAAVAAGKGVVGQLGQNGLDLNLAVVPVLVQQVSQADRVDQAQGACGSVEQEAVLGSDLGAVGGHRRRGGRAWEGPRRARVELFAPVNTA